jgi:dipeptidyl aminopeptidase/acylaminoacyl peptidase
VKRVQWVRGALGCVAALALAACKPAAAPAAPEAAPEAESEATAPAAAGDSAEPPKEGAPAAPADGKVRPVAALPMDLKSIVLEPGEVSKVTVNVDGKDRELVVSVPEGPKPWPLVLFLHGAKGAGSSQKTIKCLVNPGLEDVSPLVVAPASDKGEWWTNEDAGYVLGVIEAAKRDWPVRADRVVVTGFSNGGIGAWAYARLYPDLFSAAIPMGSNDTIMGETPVPVYAIHGSLDEMFPVEPIQANAERLKKAGFDVTLTVRNRAKHGDPCKYEDELEQAAAWLTASAWKKPKKAAASAPPQAPPSAAAPAKP